MLAEREKAMVRERFAETLTNPVTIDLYVRPESGLMIPGRQPTTSKETRALLEAVAECSDLVTLNVIDGVADPEAASAAGIERFPAIVPQGVGAGRARMFGLPGGYEFATFLEAIAVVSSGAVALHPDTEATLQALTDDLRIQVFVTPT